MRILRPETISQQLNGAGEEFLQREVSLLDKKKIRVPQILEKYHQDFGKYQTDIFRWLAKYLDGQLRLELSESSFPPPGSILSPLLLNSCSLSLCGCHESLHFRLHRDQLGAQEKHAVHT